ncbi:hypothetical protein [Desulfovibrio aminophilus]|uniref:hypothetical protein n=1 Tax=Desulfovibrio aminophilus TaxID=81425 RepID=UPI00041CDBDB|nr:hypothetical protein [Desulfovibrio aminophilus]
MRSYQIEDLTEESVRRIEARLTELGLRGSLDGIYYLPVPAELLDTEQKAHVETCGPHIMALEVIDGGRLKLELLVRGRGPLRCSCIAYATPAQRERMIDFLDQLIRDMDIAV